MLVIELIMFWILFYQLENHRNLVNGSNNYFQQDCVRANSMLTLQFRCKVIFEFYMLEISVLLLLTTSINKIRVVRLNYGMILIKK